MDSDLKKITLNAPSTPLAQPQTKQSPRLRFSKKIFIIPLSIFLGLLGGFLILFLQLRDIIPLAQSFISEAKETVTAIKSQDLEKTKITLGETRKRLDVLTFQYNKVKPFKTIPLIGAYFSDGEHAINAAHAGLDAADKAIEALEPNADLLGLKGKSTFVSGSADERIQTAVKTMSALTPKINEMASSVDKLQKEIDTIDPNRYPEKIGKTVVRNQIITAKEVIDNAASLFVNAQPLLVNLPKLLGEPTEKRYLVLFENDKELRATGGFITAYAQFRFVKGKAILERADDIYALDGALKKSFPAPVEILKFHKGVYNFYLRDSNLSPDFKQSMQRFESMYQYVSGKEAIDGIWTMDTHVLVEALRILGPINVYGRQFSADIDKRCDCPKAVYELEDYSTRPVGYVREARKDIIGVLMQTLLQQALGVSPSKYWGSLFQMLIAEINQKHIMAYFHDNDIQKAAESFNMGGRIMTASETATLLKYKEGVGWDYLHVNNSNMAGAKSNMFTTEKITKDATVTDGTLTTKLSIEYKNPYPGSDCGLESGGLCLNAPLRNWLRVYVPAGSKLVESIGVQSPKDSKPVLMDTYESLGKTVFEGFLIVNPLGTARVDLSYTSPIKSTDGKYRLLFQKQPGTDRDELILKIGGKEKKKLDIKTDTEFTF